MGNDAESGALNREQLEGSAATEHRFRGDASHASEQQQEVEKYAAQMEVMEKAKGTTELGRKVGELDEADLNPGDRVGRLRLIAEEEFAEKRQEIAIQDLERPAGELPPSVRHEMEKIPNGNEMSERERAIAEFSKMNYADGSLKPDDRTAFERITREMLAKNSGDGLKENVADNEAG